MAPVDVVDAVRLRSLPLHMGELLPAVGVAGGLGSVNVTGPTIFDGQPVNTTRMFAYVPATRFGMISDPPAFDAMLAVCGAVLKVYRTV